MEGITIVVVNIIIMALIWLRHQNENVNNKIIKSIVAALLSTTLIHFREYLLLPSIIFTLMMCILIAFDYFLTRSDYYSEIIVIFYALSGLGYAMLIFAELVPMYDDGSLYNQLMKYICKH